MAKKNEDTKYIERLQARFLYAWDSTHNREEEEAKKKAIREESGMWFAGVVACIAIAGVLLFFICSSAYTIYMDVEFTHSETLQISQTIKAQLSEPREVMPHQCRQVPEGAVPGVPDGTVLFICPQGVR